MDLLLMRFGDSCSFLFFSPGPCSLGMRCDNHCTPPVSMARRRDAAERGDSTSGAISTQIRLPTPCLARSFQVLMTPPSFRCMIAPSSC